MAITFNEVSDNRRDPGHVSELDPSGVPLAAGQKVTLLYGIHSSVSNEAAQEEVLVSSDPYAQFGASPLADLAYYYKRIDTDSLLYAIPLDADGGGAAASGSFALSGSSTAAGPLRVRVGDRRYETSLASGTAAASAATALLAELDADARSYMTGSVLTDTLTVTAPQAGTHGNDLTIDVEEIPAGLTAVVTQPSGGTTDPDTDDAIAAMGPMKLYDKVVTHLNTATELAKIETEMDLRWTAARNLEGMSYAAHSETLANTLTFGAARNSKSLTVMGSSDSPTPTWIWSAQVAARDAVMSSTPYTPRTGGWLPDCEAPSAAGVFDDDGRNSLLFSGISTFRVDNSGRVYIDRHITTYQEDSSGAADIAYLEVALMHELAHYGRTMRAVAAGETDGKNVAQNGTEFDEGVAVTTPDKVKGAIAGRYRIMERQGRVQNRETFKNTLQVEITGSNPYQIDINSNPNFTVGAYRTRHLISFSFGG